jgi:hypothetical protein
LHMQDMDRSNDDAVCDQSHPSRVTLAPGLPFS